MSEGSKTSEPKASDASIASDCWMDRRGAATLGQDAVKFTITGYPRAVHCWPWRIPDEALDVVMLAMPREGSRTIEISVSHRDAMIAEIREGRAARAAAESPAEVAPPMTNMTNMTHAVRDVTLRELIRFASEPGDEPLGSLARAILISASVGMPSDAVVCMIHAIEIAMGLRTITAKTAR